jgi:hypothetical protein
MIHFVCLATLFTMRGPVEYMTRKCFEKANQGICGFLSRSITSFQKEAPGLLAMKQLVYTGTLPLWTRNTSPSALSK